MFIVHVASYKWVNGKRSCVVWKSSTSGRWVCADFGDFDSASKFFNDMVDAGLVMLDDYTRVIYHAEIRQCEVESVALNINYMMCCGIKSLSDCYRDSKAVFAECQRLADGGDDATCPTNMSSGAAVP